MCSLSKFFFAIGFLYNVIYCAMCSKCTRCTKTGSHFTECIEKETCSSS
nr:MAG TPA: hypothetical protein [Caudoviricetes sp.]